MTIDRRATKKDGRRLEEEGRWSEAAEHYRAAIAADPGHGKWWYRLGRMCQRESDWVGAAQAYRMGLTLSPGSAVQYFRLGGALEKTGDVRGARVAYRRSEELDPRPPSLEGVAGRQLPYGRRLELSLMRKPAYAYGLLRGATLASRLGVDHICAIELGVAGGNGLLAMERHAADVEAMTGVRVDVYGFDTGEGLVAPQGNEDMPYLFAEGNYAMDPEALEHRLERARLVIGDATQTFPDFLASRPPAIGMMSFDMDLYSATIGVLRSMGADVDEVRFLPRLSLYFDDVVGSGEQDYNEYTGELLAIRDFNAEQETTKVAEDRYFRTLPLNFKWHHGMHILHRFAHPDYATYVTAAGPESLALRP